MKYRAVIVDDEHLIRSSMTKKVNECSSVHVAAAAANGVQCLEWLEQHYADICITDVRMPHMDGLELIRHINERYPWMTCLVVSSHDDFSYVRKSLQLNAVDYIMKPVEQEALHESLDAAIQKMRLARRNRVVGILMKKLPYHVELIQRWEELLKTNQEEKLGELAADTIEVLAGWVEFPYLLYELAYVWLDVVLERLRKVNAELESIQNAVEDELQVTSERMEQPSQYFRDISLKVLELGSAQLLSEMQTHKSPATSRAIELVKTYIQEHYAEKINLQEIADTVDMSRNYVANLFKKETGTTIWNYLIAVRMQKAKELLLNSSLKSYEIALKVGYESSIHFSKLFKEQYGLNPMEYKKRMQGM